MEDGYGRTIEYLRISLTDRCNLRCGYCMPEEDMPMVDHLEILRYEEIFRLVKIMSTLGVNRVRLTGGEPLMRKDIEQVVGGIKKIDGIDFLGLTTNATLLAKKAAQLQKAGLDGINISLDTMDPERYSKFTCRNKFEDAMKGINEALEAGFSSVKINCVLAPYSTTKDWLGVVSLAKKLPIDVRLIEWMPISQNTTEEVVSAQQALEAISQEFGELHPMKSIGIAGPAEYWQIEGFAGKVGMIHAMSNCFCESCNRVRLTATGDLKLCLFYDQGIALKPLLRGSAADAEIAQVVLEALQQKPLKHNGKRQQAEKNEENPEVIDRPCGMYGIGG